MGTYLNPGNRVFAEKIGPDYVDKTGLIGLINRTVGTSKKLTCISRPRRFGKSYAAQMLCAYYDKSCDSHVLFRNCKIVKNESYEQHINKYDVIYLDMTNLLGNVVPEQLITFITANVTRELLKEYPKIERGNTFDQTLINAVEFTGNRFIMIIDEWDAPIRETPEIEKNISGFCVCYSRAAEQHQKFLRQSI